MTNKTDMDIKERRDGSKKKDNRQQYIRKMYCKNMHVLPSTKRHQPVKLIDDSKIWTNASTVSKSSYQFYILSDYIKWVTTWTQWL